MQSFTFKRTERLRGRKRFTALFAKGKTFHTAPFRTTWMYENTPNSILVQAAFVVPKRNFKKASQRNRIRRRMKEAYRLNKHLLTAQLSSKNHLCIFTCLYTGKEESEYPEIEQKIIVTLQRLLKETSIYSFDQPNQP
jgi:ribonuclease P protein component